MGKAALQFFGLPPAEPHPFAGVVARRTDPEEVARCLWVGVRLRLSATAFGRLGGVFRGVTRTVTERPLRTSVTVGL
jgi:hypothetical protein